MSRCALVGIAALIATTLGAQQSDESFEVEPPVLPQNLKNESASTSNATPEPILDVARLEKDLERARKNAAGAERLYKMGALAKVEAEARALKVVRLEADLENARLVHAKEEALNRQNRSNPGEVAEANASKVEIDLSHAIQAAHAAAARREHAEVEAAEINLHRQEKLLALGSARKADVHRAEQKLAELKAQKD
jgi:hypothetical protein